MWHLVFVYLLLHSTSSFAAPSSSLPDQLDIVYTDSDPNYELWTPDSGSSPSPQRGQLGASILGPQNLPVELQNADLLAPPTTDNGDVSNFKWPFSLSHNRLSNGGWARQQNGTLLLSLSLVRYNSSSPAFSWSYAPSNWYCRWALQSSLEHI